MSYRFILNSDAARNRAIAAIDRAPAGYIASIEEPRRTLSQNDLLWALLTQVSVARPGGHRFTPDEWKSRFMHACGWDCQFLPGIADGHPFPVGFRSSKLTKSQMTNLIDFILAWGSEQGIEWQMERAA